MTKIHQHMHGTNITVFWGGQSRCLFGKYHAAHHQLRYSVLLIKFFYSTVLHSVMLKNITNSSHIKFNLVLGYFFLNFSHVKFLSVIILSCS